MYVPKLAFRANPINNKQDDTKSIVKPAAISGVGLGIVSGLYEISDLTSEEIAEMAKDTNFFSERPTEFRKHYYNSAKGTDCIKRRMSLSTILDDQQLNKEVKYWNFVKNNPKTVKATIVATHAVVVGAIFAAAGYTITFVRDRFSKKN